MSDKRWHGNKVRSARARLGALLPLVCPRCGLPVMEGMLWDVDHLVPLALGGSVDDPNNQTAAHRACNRRAGQELGVSMQRREHDVPKNIRSWL